MGLFSVTYDLRKPGQNYDGLIERLRQIGAIRPLESYWVLQSERSAAAIRDDLARYIDANDRLMVAGLTGEAAWTNSMVLNGQLQEALRVHSLT